MSIELTIQEEPHFLHVKCSGEFEPAVFVNACKEALSFASEKKIAAILIDGTRLTGERITTMDRFKIGEEFAKLQHSLPFVARVAVVGNEPLVDPNRFGETVAVNRGASGKVFTDMEEATRWLKR
jgi:hypothetical protein